MKKVLTLMFVVALLLSACGQSAPATVSEPEVTEAPTNTSIPEAPATPEASPTPEMLNPYAVISADKAEFWFPVPQKDQWEWFSVPAELSESCSCVTALVEYSWTVQVNIGESTKYYFSVDLDNRDNQSPQKGTLEELLDASNAQYSIEEIKGDGTSSYSPYFYTGISFSQLDNGLQIIVTDTEILKLINENKPEEIMFYSSRIIDASNRDEPIYDIESPGFGNFTITPEYK